MVSLLISIFSKPARVALVKFLPYFLGILLLLVTTWIVYSQGYDDGVAKTESMYETTIAEERQRQEKANRVAMNEALRMQLEFQREIDERNTEIKQILREAEEDPLWNNSSLGNDSVQRINRIR